MCERRDHGLEAAAVRLGDAQLTLVACAVLEDQVHLVELFLAAQLLGDRREGDQQVSHIVGDQPLGAPRIQNDLCVEPVAGRAPLVL